MTAHLIRMSTNVLRCLIKLREVEDGQVYLMRHREDCCCRNMKTREESSRLQTHTDESLTSLTRLFVEAADRKCQVRRQVKASRSSTVTCTDVRAAEEERLIQTHTHVCNSTTGKTFAHL